MISLSLAIVFAAWIIGMALRGLAEAIASDHRITHVHKFPTLEYEPTRSGEGWKIISRR